MACVVYELVNCSSVKARWKEATEGESRETCARDEWVALLVGRFATRRTTLPLSIVIHSPEVNGPLGGRWKTANRGYRGLNHDEIPSCSIFGTVYFHTLLRQALNIIQISNFSSISQFNRNRSTSL